MTDSSKDIDEQIKEITALIEYEEAMLDSAMKYPTDTPRFYRAMDEARVRIQKLYEKRDLLNQQKGDE